MSDTLPQFVFPANQKSDYIFNYVDSVNVSWRWNNPPEGARVGLILWLQNKSGNSFSCQSNITELGPSGNNLGSLNYESISYPVKGHYNLVAYFGNGTITGGPNSKDVTILEENTGPQCNNCTGPASSSVSTAAPTLITSAPQAGSPTTTVTLAPPTLSQPTPVPSNSLSGGEIAGTVVGVLAALAIGGALVWFFLRGRRGGSGTREQIFHNTETEPEIGTAPTSQDKPRVASPRQLYGVLEPAEKDTSDRPETRPENISSELP